MIRWLWIINWSDVEGQIHDLIWDTVHTLAWGNWGDHKICVDILRKTTRETQASRFRFEFWTQDICNTGGRVTARPRRYEGRHLFSVIRRTLYFLPTLLLHGPYWFSLKPQDSIYNSCLSYRDMKKKFLLLIARLWYILNLYLFTGPFHVPCNRYTGNTKFGLIWNELKESIPICREWMQDCDWCRITSKASGWDL
jgi:hypothetical protein